MKKGKIVSIEIFNQFLDLYPRKLVYRTLPDKDVVTYHDPKNGVYPVGIIAITQSKQNGVGRKYIIKSKELWKFKDKINV